MNLRVMGTWGVFMAFLGAAVGCSTLLVWDSDGLPCDDLGACVAGYSCLDERCVLWGSVTKGGACSDDVQCAEGSVCAGDRCATPCDGWFHRERECSPGDYCSEHPVDGGYRGHCVAGVGPEICTGVNAPCDNDDLRKYCVEIYAEVFACMKSCDISWADDASYEDTCGGDEGAGTCQPMGIHGQLVCRETRSSPGAAGATCNNVTESCAAGLACVEGICEVYCNVALEGSSSESSPCEGGRCCEEFKYGICRPECGG